jgi:hypothetical protein
MDPPLEKMAARERHRSALGQGFYAQSLQTDIFLA